MSEPQITAELARVRSLECRALAKTTAIKSHCIMLMHMSATWDRSAEAVEKAETKLPI